MPVVKAGTKEGAYGDISVYRGVVGLGISVLHRPGRSYRPEASSLTREHDGSIPSGHPVVEQSQARAGSLFGDVVHEIAQSETVRPNAVLCTVDGSSNMGGRIGSVFSLLTPDNAIGNYVKVVRGIPLRIDFDSSSGQVFHAEGLVQPDLSSDPHVSVR